MGHFKTWISSNRKGLLIFLLLVCVFSVSVKLRSKHLVQPMSRHHEWLTAHSLVTLQVWEQNGLSNSHYSLRYSYNNPGDRYDYTICALFDKNGNAYYVSYGPFALLLPYTVFKVLQVPMDQTSLTVFNLVIHFFISLFIYLIVLRLAGKTFNRFSLAAFTGFILYVFSPGTLWFHGNIYFNEILAQLLVAIGLYVFTLILLKKQAERKLLVVYGIVCFCCVYNEWMGLFFVFFASLYFFIALFFDRWNVKPFLVGAFSGLLALALIVVQYSSIAGFDQLMEVEKAKFSQRNGGSIITSGHTEENYSFQSTAAFENIKNHITSNFKNVLYVLAFFLIVFVVMTVVRKKYFLTREQGLLLLVLGAVVFFHHYIFFNFTSIHDFSVLKTGLFMVLLAALVLSRLEKLAAGNKTAGYALMFAVMGLLGAQSWKSYERYDEINHLSTIYPGYQNMGAVIRQHAKPGERVFSNLFACPVTNIYAQRNVQYDANGQGARAYAINSRHNSVFFKDAGGTCVQVIHYNTQGDSVVVDPREKVVPAE